MMEDEKKIVEAFQKCADVRLPDGFADRLVRRIREKGHQSPADNHQSPSTSRQAASAIFARLALVAASLTLFLGFVPGVFEGPSEKEAVLVARCDEIRPVGHTLPQDSQLNALAFLGFCREVIRRRVKPLVERLRRREDEVW